MKKKTQKYNSTCIKIYTVFFFITLLLIPLILSGRNFNNNELVDDPIAKISDYSKDDYNPILTEEKYGLGNTTVDAIDLSELEMGFTVFDAIYPDIGDDYNMGFLNMTFLNMKFVETTEPAIIDNLNPNIEDNSKIIVTLNESLFFEYSNMSKGYLIYHSRLWSSTLLEFYVDDGTNIFELQYDVGYRIDENDFIVFDYETYFQKTSNYNNFTVYFIWEYQISLQFWSLTQYTVPKLMINDSEQNFTVKFNYYFLLLGYKFGETIQDTREVADNIYGALTMNLPDKNLLDNHNLLINNVSVNINDHINLDKSVAILLSDHFSFNRSYVSLNFTSSFTLKFMDPVKKTWAIDRLVAMRNIRERIYFPSLIAGPTHIYLKHIVFYEYTIFFDQVMGSSSLFERDVNFYFLNASITGREGIEIEIPYLIAGETCPFKIKYAASQSLRIVITDSIKMPLVGASIELFYYGQTYGTYISNERAQPIAPGSSNENGEIILDDVPAGNYTVKTYHNGILLIESTISTENNINFIYTNYPHFPLWIIIFGLINGIILIFGAMLYLKNKRML